MSSPMFITMDSFHTIDTYIPKELMNVVDYLGLFTLGPSYTLVYWVMAKLIYVWIQTCEVS